MKKALSLLGCAALLALASATAHADTVFNVSGIDTAYQGQSCGVDCAFSGTLTINTATGTLDAIDITFPGLSSFDTLYSNSVGSTDLVIATNPPEDNALYFSFTTPGTLVGFDGGTIVSAIVLNGLGDRLFVGGAGGTISAAPAATPEPSSLMLLGSGLIGLAGLARRRLR